MAKPNMSSLPQMFRECQMSVLRQAPSAEGEPALYEVSVSSETEVERWFGFEVLAHEKSAVDMSRLRSGAAVLVDHGGDQVGVVEKAWLDESTKRLKATLRFSRNARGQEVERDVQDGIRQNISVGYFVKKAKMVEERNGQEVWRVTRWQPAEVSIVGVPADYSVGIGRAQERGAFPVEIEGGERAVEVTRMKKVKTDSGSIIEVRDDDPRPAVSQDDFVAAERERVTGIFDLCAANRMQDKASAWAAEGIPVGEAAMRILKERKTNGVAQPGSESLLTEKEAKRYSYARAILCAAQLAEGGKLDGFEAEVHQELVRKAQGWGIPLRGGILMPLRLGSDKLQHRVQTAAGATTGSTLVFEESGELIELLRNRTTAIQMGARTLTGLTAPISFPKQTAAMTASWVGENPGTDVGDSDIVLGLAQLAAKTLQASGAYSRQLLMQASLDVEAMVREEFAAIHARAIDRAFFQGKGAGGEPAGVYKAVGVSTKAFGGTADYAKLVDMLISVATSNADMGTLGYVTTILVAGNLKKALDFPASSAGRPIWTGTFADGEVAGYKAMASNQMSGSMTGSEDVGGTDEAVVFGNFADAVIGSFGALETIVDPFRLKKQGVIEATSFQMCDILIRHGESFCKGTGCTG